MKTWASKIRDSLRRDRGLPLTRTIAKGLDFAIAAASAPFHLHECDRVGPRARTRGCPDVDNMGRIEIGSDFLASSVHSPIRLRTGSAGTLTLGDEVTLNFGVSIAADEHVVIGNRASLGPYVAIADSDSTMPARPSPVVVGDDVWLASRVRVMQGATIGNRTVVTAGSVVMGDLPSDVVAGGVPARVLFSREPKLVVPAPDRPALARCILIADFSITELGHRLSLSDDRGFRIDATVAPFGQVAQTLLAPGLDQFDCAVVWTRPEAISPQFNDRLHGKSVSLEAIVASVDDFVELIASAAKSCRHIIVPTWMLPPNERGLGVGDMSKDGLASAILRMNLRLVERLEGVRNVVTLDTQRWVLAGGFNAKLWYLAKIAFQSSVLDMAAADIRSVIRTLRGGQKKLIVVDLDDTLWGGVVGDVGWENLKLGGHDAAGEAFADFQTALLTLSRRGIALAIASKNSEDVALEAIRQHPAMVLRPDDFAAHRINWDDKAQNIVDIAAELNLGLGSIVFIDDNPIERARVRDALPEVYVPEWPRDSLLYASTLRGLTCFDTFGVTQEDWERKKMYREEKHRTALKSVGSVDDWVAGLGVCVRFARLDPSNVKRAAQLLNKTNQMNLRTRRLGEAELSLWASGRGHEVWVVHVTDRFGDSGLTGILGLDLSSAHATIADYVLSCRVLGRRVEDVLVWAAVERARAAGARELSAPFQATERNAPCLAFWRKSGFDENANGVFTWDLRTECIPPRAVVIEGLDRANEPEAAVG